MPVPVRVRFARRIGRRVIVLVVGVVDMTVLVIQRLVQVLVVVAFR